MYVFSKNEANTPLNTVLPAPYRPPKIPRPKRCCLQLGTVFIYSAAMPLRNTVRPSPPTSGSNLLPSQPLCGDSLTTQQQTLEFSSFFSCLRFGTIFIYCGASLLRNTVCSSRRPPAAPPAFCPRNPYAGVH